MPRRIELVPLTTFTFFGNASQVQEVQLIKYIPTEGFVSGMFELRAAARTLTSTQAIALVLQAISKAEDEPQATYVTSTAEDACSVSASTPTALPALVTRGLSTPLPAFYRLIVRATQASTASSMSVTLSSSLTLRES